MKKIAITLFAVLIINATHGSPMEKNKEQNPLLAKFTTPHHTAPFDKIKTEHYLPAFTQLINEEEAAIDQIASNPKNPTFDNTIVALELAGEKLSTVSGIFFNLTTAETNSKMQEVAQQVSPLLTKHASKITLNTKLFARIKAIYDQMGSLNLTTEQKRLVDNYYKEFIRSGANLNEVQKKRYVEIKTELSKLTLNFGDNVLAETNKFTLHLTNESDLTGLPQYVRDAASLEAKKRKLEGWVFTLQIPSYLPFMQFSEKRDLREKMYRAYTSKGNQNNSSDNKENIRKIVNLRLELANLMGFKSYAQYVLQERMAETPERVNHFLLDLHNASHPFAEKEFKEISSFAAKSGADFDLQRWDWTYYSDKLKQEKYGFSDEIIKPYFELGRVINGVFGLATKLYGISFKEVNNIPKYHPEVKTYEVADEKGKFLAVLYLDFFPRAGKKGGAWMTEYLGQSNINGQEIRPHISLVTNFTKPTETTPSLLTFDEVTTFLHEFGHALHGMLSRCTYPSLSGTNVYRDFVELPSQFMENFAVQKEWLDQFAVHYQTGEKMPEELIKK
ncbi:MAG: M3 family metallopeptidase, partial [Bacteroidota bacterium]|nr:M3 family metallopeptidase [Bacteroidota bacterium]